INAGLCVGACASLPAGTAVCNDRRAVYTFASSAHEVSRAMVGGRAFDLRAIDAVEAGRGVQADQEDNPRFHQKPPRRRTPAWPGPTTGTSATLFSAAESFRLAPTAISTAPVAMHAAPTP